jgi:hypothetical protein
MMDNGFRKVSAQAAIRKIKPWTTYGIMTIDENTFWEKILGGFHKILFHRIFNIKFFICLMAACADT